MKLSVLPLIPLAILGLVFAAGPLVQAMPLIDQTLDSSQGAQREFIVSSFTQPQHLETPHPTGQGSVLQAPQGSQEEKARLRLEATARIRLARTLERTLKKRGHQISVEATGNGHRILRLTSQHMRGDRKYLKKGTPALQAAWAHTVDCHECMRQIKNLKFKEVQIWGKGRRENWSVR